MLRIFHFIMIFKKFKVFESKFEISHSGQQFLHPEYQCYSFCHRASCSSLRFKDWAINPAQPYCHCLAAGYHGSSVSTTQHRAQFSWRPCRQLSKVDHTGQMLILILVGCSLTTIKPLPLGCYKNIGLSESSRDSLLLWRKWKFKSKTFLAE